MPISTTFVYHRGRSKDPSFSEITKLLLQEDAPYSTQAPYKRVLDRTLKKGSGRIVASSSLTDLLERLCAILGLSLHADNAAVSHATSPCLWCSVPQLVLHPLIHPVVLRAAGGAAISDTVCGAPYRR